jgi:DNA-binding HxlR family transcriptional regulator
MYMNTTRRAMRGIKKELSVARMVEDIVGCKWSLVILQQVRQGINRPGALERSVDGLTTKVLNERLKKLVRYGILQRHAYPEIPPRVEYSLTLFGDRFAAILDAIAQLEQESFPTSR